MGLGHRFPADWLGPGWDTEKTYVDAGDGPINSYDHSKYEMDFTFDARIDSFKELAVKECLMPMATIWFIDDTGALDVAILHELEAGGAGTVMPRDVMNDGTLIFDIAPLEEVFNDFLYRFDHDPLGTNDVQGSTVGPTPFITERRFTELEMGDEDTPSLARFQSRPMPPFDVRGLRGFGSVQYGLSWAYNADRTVYERARVWLTRQRFRVPHYEMALALRKESLRVGESIDVTSEAIVNGSLGTMGRTASKMVVRALSGPDYSSCLMIAALVAHGDMPAIVNTNIAATMPTPDPDDWILAKRPQLNTSTGTAFEKMSIGFRKSRVYVRGFTNLATVILQYLASPPPRAPVNGASPEIPDYMMTRVYGCPALELATDLAAIFYDAAWNSSHQSSNPASPNWVGLQGQKGTIRLLVPWAAGTSYTLGKIVFHTASGLFYKRLAGWTLGDVPPSTLGVSWEIYPSADRYQVVTELRAPDAEDNIMFSSGNNTQLSADNATASTKNQFMFVRIAYVNNDWVEGPLSDCKVVSGANFSDDLGDRMYRGKLMQTITGSDGRTRTTWGSGRS